MTRRAATGVALVLWVGLVSCARRDVPVQTFSPDLYPDTLAPWGIVNVQDRALRLGRDVVPYDLATPLFSDYAHKLRTVWFPPGTVADYTAEDVFQLPVGTVISKTFYFPRERGSNAVLATEARGADPVPPGLSLDDVHLLETRLLVHQPSGWEPLVYVWNDTQDTATLEIAGDLKPLQAVMDDGERRTINYLVPTRNDCAGCHTTNHTTRRIQPIGLAARHLDKVYDRYAGGPAPQLTRWQQLGILNGLPDTARPPANMVWDPSANDQVEHRARSYLDINCGHCHNAHGPADTSGLFLDIAEESTRRLGFCKPTIAAGRGSGGRSASIVPGEPDASILMFRMESSDPAEMMPELGRTVVHAAGARLIRTWIESLEGRCT